MADFTFSVHRVTPHPRKYNVLLTTMEGWLKKARMKSTEGYRKWDVEIRGRTNTEKAAIVSHYEGQNGELTPFNWVVTPSFFEGGNTYYVRYESFTHENPDGLGNVWNFSITFVEELV